MIAKRLLALICTIGIGHSLWAAEKVLIITHSYCRPDFIELHDKTFKAFLQDEYEYVVFNDAPDNAMCKQIERTCQKLNIRCIRVPQELHAQRNDPGARHIHGLMHSMNTVGFDHDGIVFVIDSDMFLFKPFSVNEYLGEAHIAGQKDVRPHVGPVEVTYMTPLLVFINMKTAPAKRTINFDGGIVNGHACDVGGHLHYYLKDTPNLSIKFLPGVCVTALAEQNNEQQLRSLGYDDITATWVKSLEHHFDPSDPHRLQFHGDNHFMHYVAGGSNWNHRSQTYHQKKTRIITQFIDQMIERYSK